MMKRKSLLVGVLICGLLAFQTPALAARSYVDNGMQCQEAYFPTADVHKPSPTIPQPPTIHIDGKYIVTDVDPTIISGRTLMPFRAAGEALGAAVEWDHNTYTAIAKKDGKTVKFKIGSKTYSVNGKTYSTDVAPTIINNRTLLPLRAFAQAFDANVDWNGKIYDVIIDTAAPNAPAENIPVGTGIEAQKYIQKYYIAPSNTDPYVGSWHKSETYNGTVTDTYMFVSPYKEGYHCVQVTIEDSPHLNTDIITIMRDDAMYFYDSVENVEALLVHYDQQPTFYRGPARGWTLEYIDMYSFIQGDFFNVGRIELPSEQFIDATTFYPYTQF